MKIVADANIPFLRGALEPFAEVVYLPGGAIRAEDVCDADALLVRTRTRCDRDLLEGSRVRFVFTATIGYDHIDTGYLAGRGIFWSNAPGCNAPSVASYMAGVLSLCASGKKSVGVVGVGQVGGRVAKVARAMGFEVLLNDPPRAEKEGREGFVELDELLEKSDVVTMHVPLEKGGKYPTFHLAGGELFAAMKPDALFVNAARGAVCDNRALLAHLLENERFSAVLDVWENEPAIDLELLRRVAFGTPHVAGYSADGKANGTAAAVRALGDFFAIPQLRQWQVVNVPPPDGCAAVIELDNLPESEQLRAALRGTGGVEQDSAALKSAPQKFESLRDSYRVRRDIKAFSVRGGAPEVRSVLKNLGFTLL